MRPVNQVRALVFLLSILVAFDATARGRGHGGGHRGGSHSGGYHQGGRSHYGGGHFHRRPSFGFYFGPSWGWPYYYPSYFGRPYYYPYPPVIVQQPISPPVYIERSEPLDGAPSPGYWNYCQNPEGYAPYVKECAAGWQQISVAPTGQELGYWYYCDAPSGYYPYIKECPRGWRKLIPDPAKSQTPTSP